MSMECDSYGESWIEAGVKLYGQVIFILMFHAMFLETISLKFFTTTLSNQFSKFTLIVALVHMNIMSCYQV